MYLILCIIHRTCSQQISLKLHLWNLWCNFSILWACQTQFPPLPLYWGGGRKHTDNYLKTWTNIAKTNLVLFCNLVKQPWCSLLIFSTLSLVELCVHIKWKRSFFLRRTPPAGLPKATAACVSVVKQIKPSEDSQIEKTEWWSCWNHKPAGQRCSLSPINSEFDIPSQRNVVNVITP